MFSFFSACLALLAIALVTAKLLFVRSELHSLTSTRIRRLVERRAERHGLSKDDAKTWEVSALLFEEAWEGLGSLLLWLICCWVLAGGYNSGCTLYNTAPCLADWPHGHITCAPAASPSPSTPAVDTPCPLPPASAATSTSGTASASAAWPTTLLYLLQSSWYLHNNVQQLLGIATATGADMAVHHAATLALVALSYVYGLTRMGVLALAIFNASSPLLHASRVTHYLDMRRAKWAAFLAFAAVFFASRLLLVPGVLLRAALVDGAKVLPEGLYWCVSLLLLLLAVMQLFWMYKIARVIVTGKAGQASSRLSERAGARRARRVKLVHAG